MAAVVPSRRSFSNASSTSRAASATTHTAGSPTSGRSAPASSLYRKLGTDSALFAQGASFRGPCLTTADLSMRNDDFTPDLTRLERDYQILTELHRSHHSRTYLARHLGLNRDVTVTVVRAADGSDNSDRDVTVTVVRAADGSDNSVL